MNAYADALCVHLARQASLCAAYTVDTVYFGGGTPSLMGQNRLARIWNAVTANYHLSPDAEITLEANPDSAGGWLDDLRAAGFNRISLGMQSASNRELREIGRIHTCEGVQAAVETIRRAGFENLSLDLIYGLPGQTMDSWENSLRAALDLETEHLSCYGLKLCMNGGKRCLFQTRINRRIFICPPWKRWNGMDTGSMRFPTLPVQTGSRGTISNTGRWWSIWDLDRVRIRISAGYVTPMRGIYRAI